MDEVNCEMPIDRRIFLGSATLAAAPFGAPCLGQPPGDAPARPRAFPGMISRQRNPDNLEFPFQTLEAFLTANEQFYVRNHFEVPKIDLKTWRLRIEGAVEKPYELGYDELRKMTTRTQTALLECSGNSRVLLRPPQLGVRWDQGAVSNAEWTGVSLAALLERAVVRKNAVEVILEGVDRGEYRSPTPATPGVINYARSFPLEKARRPEVLLAHRMNGADLPAAHGFPVRAVIPGWYGMASVKWLKRIIVTDRPFHGYFQTFSYTIWERRGGLPELTPVTEMQIKAQIARPVLHEVVPAGMNYRVFGAAWTGGDAEVAGVDVSTNGGKDWSRARLLDRSVRYAWRFWEYEWAAPKQPGRYTLMARATDNQKRVQPLERNDDYRDAVIHHVQRIQVEVR